MTRKTNANSNGRSGLIPAFAPILAELRVKWQLSKQTKRHRFRARGLYLRDEKATELNT